MASSLAGLKAEIMAELQAAVAEAEQKAISDTKAETQGYYSGSPRIYTRSGNLGRSPRTSGVHSGGNSAGFEIWLEPGDYTSVNAHLRSLGFRSYFSGLQALTAAEHGTDRVLGNSGFWARSESKIEADLNNALGSHFG